MERTAEKYHGETGDFYETMTSRDRIHWMVQWARGPRVLDFGCAQGITTKLLAKKGYDVLGYDRDEDAIAYAKRRFSGIPFTDRLEDLGIGYDSILIGGLDREEDPERLLRDLVGRVSPEGRIILTVRHGLCSFGDRRPFTMTSFLDLVEPILGIVQLAFVDGFIRFAGSTHETDWQVTSAVRREAEHDLALVQRRERARAELVHAEYHRARERTLELTKQIRELRQRPIVRLVGHAKRARKKIQADFGW